MFHPFVMNLPGSEINRNLIAFGRGVVEFRALNNRKTGVDRVAIKRSRKRAGNDSLDPEAHNRGDRLLARTAAAKVSAGDENVEMAQLVRKPIAQDFESVFG